MTSRRDKRTAPRAVIGIGGEIEARRICASLSGRDDGVAPVCSQSHRAAFRHLRIWIVQVTLISSQKLPRQIDIEAGGIAVGAGEVERAIIGFGQNLLTERRYRSGVPDDRLGPRNAATRLRAPASAPGFAGFLT